MENKEYWHICYVDKDGEHSSRIEDRHPYEWEKIYIESYTLLSFQKLTQEDIEAAKKAKFLE